MTRVALSILLSFFLFANVASAKVVLKKDIPDTLTFDDKELILNGAGVRSKFVYDLYIAALYLKEPSTDPVAIMEADETMALRLYITSDLLTEKRFIKYTYKGFKKSTNNNLGAIDEQVQTLLNSFEGAVNKGDMFEFVYKPGIGTEIYRNGEKRAVGTSLEFKKAFWGIWLSKKPVTVMLRNQMLGIE